jgi:peptidoglycan-associated lipoprotein
MRTIPAILLLAGCPHKPPPTDEVGTDGLDPARSLQVAMVLPGQLPANQPASVRISGSGFQAGATVSIGGQTQVTANRVDSNNLVVSLPALQAGIFDVTVTNPDAESATLRGGLTVGGISFTGYGPECQGVTVYFGLDQAGLTDEARSTLTARMSCWTGNESPLTVEGHADERGTTDYNLALGNRRAEAVRTFLAGQGVSAARMRAVSWGEERPADTGHSEAAWAHNRRGVIVPGR